MNFRLSWPEWLCRRLTCAFAGHLLFCNEQTTFCSRCGRTEDNV